MTNRPKPMTLIILDGWGHREETQHNPIQQVKTPFIDFLFETYPHTLIEASGEAVGLPPGQMGNSEVGHLHIGAGRRLSQDLTRINEAIESGAFFNNIPLQQAIQSTEHRGGAIHVMGLLSTGGVHSSNQHITAMIDMIGQQSDTPFYVHAFLDGRDTPPQSALTCLQRLDAQCKYYPNAHVASVIGRYYAMDRDHRWERTQKAYDLLTIATAEHHAHTAEAALQQAYARGETDEFVQATVVSTPDSTPATLNDGDTVIFMNFRADRARQLTQALTDPDFDGFTRQKTPHLSQCITLTEYAKTLNTDVAFPPISVPNNLGEYVAKQGLHQLRIAETEKYAHVTYFINGGREKTFEHEDRILIPSPKVATYDLQPEMSAEKVTEKLIEAIASERYDLIICNYANPDMIGHTGINAAAKAAVSMMDTCLKRVVSCLQVAGGEAIITADHGNIEIIYDEVHQQPHTAHTNNLVPLIYVGRHAKCSESAGALDDIAPTLLYLMGLEKPEEMTGRSLIAMETS